MTNILSKEFDTNISYYTPVFPKPTNYSSSIKGSVDKSIPKIHINTSKNLRKEGVSLYIDENIYDLNHKNIYDFLQILDENNIDNQLVNNEDYCNYPALCLLDFNNKETYSINCVSSPFNIKHLKRMKSNTLIFISAVEFKVISVLDVTTKKYMCRVEDDFILIDNYIPDCKLIYSVQCNEFIIRLGNKFSTNNKEMLSRYMDYTYDKD